MSDDIDATMCEAPFDKAVKVAARAGQLTPDGDVDSLARKFYGEEASVFHVELYAGAFDAGAGREPNPKFENSVDHADPDAMALAYYMLGYRRAVVLRDAVPNWYRQIEAIDWQPHLTIGMRVATPLKGRMVRGVVVRVTRGLAKVKCTVHGDAGVGADGLMALQSNPKVPDLSTRSGLTFALQAGLRSVKHLDPNESDASKMLHGIAQDYALVRGEFTQNAVVRLVVGLGLAHQEGLM